MKKPNGFDEVVAGGDFERVELGGHKMVIKQVVEQTSSTGKPMIVVLFDFAKGDKQEGYFMKSFQSDIRPDKKWSNQATKYILTEDENGICSKSCKSFVTCVESSNNGFTVQWGIENWAAQFKGKAIGGVFGEEMDFYNGEEKKKRVLRWFTSIDKVDEAKIPDMSETKAFKEHKNAEATANTDMGFMDIPDGIEENLPFN